MLPTRDDAALQWQPDAKDLVLLAGYERDLPTIERLAASLPTKSRGQIFIEVDSADDIRDIAVPGRVSVRWLMRERGQSLDVAVDAWLSEMLPVEAFREHQVLAWISGDRAARFITSD